jgi:uncharacterized protein
MPRRFWVPALLVFAILAASAGVFRLRFDTDILSMLPDELPEVKGLKAFHEAFSRNDEMIVLIEGGEADEGTLGVAAESLGKRLQADGVVKKARWQPSWMSEPDGLSDLLAYLWLNGDPATTKTLAEKLQPGKSAEIVKASLSQVATSMDGMDIAMQAHDPFGFLQHPAVTALTSAAGQGSGEAYESPDGRAHLLFISAPTAMPGYREAADWIVSVKRSVASWQQTDGKGLKVRYTGEPAFASEIGKSMEYDLSGSIGITLALIALLFWWMQRRLSLLAGLTGILILVFAVAMGMAGWMYGKLSIMALSSAEILIGLAVDYGLVICQEAKVAGHDRQALLAASGRPVLCGALTTTVVFLALNLGGMPGMAQLGTIVAVGLAAAGIMMIVLYLPFVAKFGVDRQPASGSGKFLPRRRLAWSITALLSLAAITLLAVHGMPKMVFDSNIIRPRHSEAMESFESVRAAFPTFDGEALGLVVEAQTDAEMRDRLAEAHRRVDAAKTSGMIATGTLPFGWWPDPTTQQVNRSAVKALAADRDRLLEEADAAGYSAEGLALGKSVLESMARQSAETTMIFPQSESAREVMRLFMTRRADGGGYVLGNLAPAKGMEPTGKDYERYGTMNGGGIWLSSWGLFKPALSKLIKADITRMLLPMMGLLLVMMFFIFRRAADVGIALFAMVISTLLLLAIMSAAGLKWNFVNLMATPLLLGTGIDYAIHVTLTLRRTGGCFKELWNGTGKALLFCGVSNVIGFGSLIWSSSEALVSLGVVAVIGITLSMAVSLFLLPGWRATVE